MAFQQLLGNIAETLQKGTTGGVGDFVDTFGGVVGMTSKLRPMQLYKVVDRKTDELMGTYSSLPRALHAVDKLDDAYGGYRYRHMRLEGDEFTKINKHLLLPASIVE